MAYHRVCMSYDLKLRFDPAIAERDFLQYFASRRHFASRGSDIAYQNPDTGVGFVIRYQSSKAFLARTRISGAHFEMNYFRPRFFGVEAEMELSAMVARFAPSIEDPQMHGMGQGPYAGEGFLRGWNFGNELAVRAILNGNPNPQVKTMPAGKLQAAWTWNYKKPQRLAEANDQQFVPGIMPIAVRDTPSLVAVWALGMPVLLPSVDYVLVGRDDSGVKRYGLAPWSEVLAVVQSAGIDIGSDPLDIRYAVTPAPIARWVAEISEVDPKTLPRLSFDEIIDSEIAQSALR